MQESVQDWIAAYRAGDIESLGRLVEHFRRPLYAYLLRVSGKHADAEELFQETWLRAVRTFDRFDNRNLLSWLLRIGHNLCIDRFRKNSRLVDLHGPDREAASPEESLPAREPDPARQAGHAELGSRIRLAVDQLPSEQREVFLLRTEGEIPFREIAVLQKIPLNTALARMQYALARLRGALRDDYELLKEGLQ